MLITAIQFTKRAEVTLTILTEENSLLKLQVS